MRSPKAAADGSAAATLPFFDPATGVQLGTAPDSDDATVDRAFQAAHTAFQSYKRTTPAERQAMMLKLADLIEANVDRLLDAEVACTGKPRQVTREIEILRGADQLRFFAGACRVVSGTAQTEYVRGFSSTVRREPLGVVAQITPWNYPFMMAIWKIGPALAAGNTLVLKPADTTPWSTLVLGELAQEAYPAGVVNVICGGRGTGAAMVDHEIPEMVSITGSTRAGAQVMSAASKTLKDVHLELGGKAPAIVFADTDIDLAAKEIALGAFFNAGQDCTAVTRVLVEESIHQEFGSALAAAAAALQVGGDAADLGPLNSAAQLDRVEGFMSRLPANAKVLAGGKRTGAGFHFEPTVIDGVFQADEVVCEEIFGPVVTIQPFPGGVRGHGARQRHEVRAGLQRLVEQPRRRHPGIQRTGLRRRLDQLPPGDSGRGPARRVQALRHRQGPLRLWPGGLHPHQVSHHLPPLKEPR